MSWKNSSGIVWSDLLSSAVLHLLQQRHMRQRGFAEQCLLRADVGLGETVPSGVIFTSPSLHGHESQQRRRFDDGQQVVHVEQQFVRHVIHIFFAAAVDQQLQQPAMPPGRACGSICGSGFASRRRRGRRKSSSGCVMTL